MFFLDTIRHLKIIYVLTVKIESEKPSRSSFSFLAPCAGGAQSLVCGSLGVYKNFSDGLQGQAYFLGKTKGFFLFFVFVFVFCFCCLVALVFVLMVHKQRWQDCWCFGVRLPWASTGVKSTSTCLWGLQKTGPLRNVLSEAVDMINFIKLQLLFLLFFDTVAKWAVRGKHLRCVLTGGGFKKKRAVWCYQLN